jgi:hypothetical protein
VFDVPEPAAASLSGEPSLYDDDRPMPRSTPAIRPGVDTSVYAPPPKPTRTPAMVAIEADAVPPPLPRAGQRTIAYAASASSPPIAVRPALDSTLSDLLEGCFLPCILIYLLGLVVIHLIAIANFVQADVDVPFAAIVASLAYRAGSLFLLFGPALAAGMSLAAIVLRREQATDGYLRACGVLAIYGLLVLAALFVGVGAAMAGSVVPLVVIGAAVVPLFFVTVRYAFRTGYGTTILGSLFTLIFGIVLMVAVNLVLRASSGMTSGTGALAMMGAPTAERKEPRARPAAGPGVTVAAQPTALSPMVPTASATGNDASPGDAGPTPPSVLASTGSPAADPVDAPATEPTEPPVAEPPIDLAAAEKAWAPLRATIDEAVTIRPTANNVDAIEVELRRARAAAANLATRHGRSGDAAAKVYAGLITLEDNLRIAEEAVIEQAKTQPVDVNKFGTTGPTTTGEAAPADAGRAGPAIPSNAVLIDEALASLKAPDPAARAVALRVLADLKPNERRPEVAEAVESIMLEPGAALLDESAAALRNWWGPKTAIRLLALLDPDVAEAPRRAAMDVLAATKDRRAVWPIARWLLKDPDRATPALVRMGPVAEDDMIKLLLEKDANARRLGAKVLAEVGGVKSIQPLQRAARDNRDPAAAAVAGRALEAVKDRVASK